MGKRYRCQNTTTGMISKNKEKEQF